jgi:hypothetical protein
MPLDAYYTPPELALAICDRVRSAYCPEPKYVLEPSAGSGVVVNAIHLTWPKAVIDAVEPEPPERKYANADFTQRTTLEVFGTKQLAYGYVFDLAIGNPPFSLAEDHLRILLGYNQATNFTVAMLLRNGFLESKRRVKFWKEFPLLAFIPIVPRPAFDYPDSTGGTDSQCYGLFVWQYANGEWQRGTPETLVWR